MKAKRLILVFFFAGLLAGANGQSLGAIALSVKVLPAGAINIASNAGTPISAANLNSQLLAYAGKGKIDDIGGVVFYYPYNSTQKAYDGLATVLEDQETVNGPVIFNSDDSPKRDANGEELTEKFNYSNKITVLGKLSILSGYTTLAIRYESFEQVEIFFYNYDSSGMLLSCFLAASNEKVPDWDNKTSVVHQQSLMTATIGADNKIRVLTEGDSVIDQTFQLTSDGHFRVISETVTEYPD